MITERPMQPAPKTATVEPSSWSERRNDVRMEMGGGRRGGERTDARLFHDSSVAGGDSTAEQADLVEGCLRVDGDDGDIGYDGVLREC